jgi:signal transduction histidine kinase
VSALGVGIPALLGYDVAWSTVAYTVLVIAALAAAAWSTHKLMKRNERLEQLVEQRTSHIQMQARQLARYNAELIRSNKMLQQTMDEKSKVLGVAAHDLKNSVFGICALSEVMLEEDAGNGQSVRRLSLIHNSAEEAMTLINNLLSSAASSVHGDLEKQAVNVGTMAELVRHSFADQAKRKQQQITCDGPATDTFVEGDEDRLREALNNLVSNAVKYAPLNSTIRLAVQATDDNIYVSVADEGPGLSPHEQEALFTPFKRLSPEPTGNEGSSGLGLYIVQQIVDRHEGTIRVDSTKGEGSTFTVMLPRIDPPESAVNLEPSAHDQKPVMGY